MSIKTLTENFWTFYNTSKLDKAIQQFSKIEKWYEDVANRRNDSTAEEYKKVYLKSMSWAIIQAHEMKAEELKKYYGDPHEVEAQ